MPIADFWSTDFWNNLYRGTSPNRHRGIDVSPWDGNRNLTALATGEVVFIGRAPGGELGLCIVVRVSARVFHTYCHTAARGISVGDTVYLGQGIGLSVVTRGLDAGTAWTGRHCHLVSSTHWAAAWNPSYYTRDPAGEILAALASDSGSQPAGDQPTTIDEDDDMAQYDLIQTPDGTIWWCVDRAVRYAIPNQATLDTYKVFYKQKTGFTAQVTSKSTSQADAYGQPVFANPLSRYATPTNVAGSTKAILLALSQQTSGGDAGELAAKVTQAVTEALEGIEVAPIDYARLEALLDDDKAELLTAIAGVDEETLSTFGLARIFPLE